MLSGDPDSESAQSDCPSRQLAGNLPGGPRRRRGPRLRVGAGRLGWRARARERPGQRLRVQAATDRAASRNRTIQGPTSRVTRAIIIMIRVMTRIYRGAEARFILCRGTARSIITVTVNVQITLGFPDGLLFQVGPRNGHVGL